MLPHRQVPVIINSFNRLGSLRRLMRGFMRPGTRRSSSSTNASRYHRCVDYLTSLEAARLATVLRLDGNYGHKALWERGLLSQLGIETEYVYTDPDVVPCDFCPADAIRFLQVVLASEPRIARVGLGLRLDDLPDSYRHKREAIGWERHFWLKPAARGLFFAKLDSDLRPLPPARRLGPRTADAAHRLALSRRPRRLVPRQRAPERRDLVYSREASPK